MDASPTLSPNAMAVAASLQLRLNQRMHMALSRRQRAEGGVTGSAQRDARETAVETWFLLQERLLQLSRPSLLALLDDRRREVGQFTSPFYLAAQQLMVRTFLERTGICWQGHDCLEQLRNAGPPKAMYAQRECVAILQELPNWYPGGTKELRVCLRTRVLCVHLRTDGIGRLYMISAADHCSP